MFNTLNTEESNATWIDGFALEHSIEAPDGSNDDVRSFPETLLIFADVSPADGEVSSDDRSCCSSGYKCVHCMRSLAGWAKDDCLSFFDGAIEFVDDHIKYCLRFSW